MGMDDAAGFRVAGIDAAVQRQRLRRPATGHRITSQVDLGNLGRIEPAKAGIGRRDQPAIVKARADIAGGAHGIAALIQAHTRGADFLADLRFFTAMDS